MCVCEGTATRLQTVPDISELLFLNASHTRWCFTPLRVVLVLGVGHKGGGGGWGGLITQLHVFHLATSHNVQRVTVFVTALSVMYAFKVFHCEVMLKVVLITLLTAEPYGFPS